MLKESAELGNLLHDEEKETDGNSARVAKRYKEYSPQVFGDQPLGLKHDTNLLLGETRSKSWVLAKQWVMGIGRIISLI